MDVLIFIQKRRHHTCNPDRQARGAGMGLAFGTIQKCQEHLPSFHEASDNTPYGNKLEGTAAATGFQMTFIQLREHLSGFDC